MISFVVDFGMKFFNSGIDVVIRMKFFDSGIDVVALFLIITFVNMLLTIFKEHRIRLGSYSKKIAVEGRRSPCSAASTRTSRAVEGVAVAACTHLSL
eukprot:tig00020786_g13709.t1